MATGKGSPAFQCRTRCALLRGGVTHAPGLAWMKDLQGRTDDQGRAIEDINDYGELVEAQF